MALLSEILSSRTRAEIFRLLFGANPQVLHLREMERRSGLRISTLREDLKKLSSLDLVSSRRDGNRLYYHANQRHPLYHDIRNLVLKTSGLADVLRSALQKDGVEVAFVFGSIAKGKENADSDVDLMVVGDAGLRAVTRWLSGIPEKLGREINPHTITLKEFKKRKSIGDHFLTSVLSSAKLFIVGSEDDLEAMGRERLVEAAQDKQ